MSDPTIDTSKIPSEIKTPEQYIEVCETFALPLMYKQAVKIMEAVEELHEAVSNNPDIAQEKLDLFANKIKGYAAFANDNSPIYPLLESIAKLEEQFEEQGFFDEEGAED